VSLLEFVQWLSETSGSVALLESLYMYPLIESFHVWTLAMFVGFAVMLDMRLLGWILRDVPVSEVARRLLPWTIGAFVIMVVTGVLLFYGIPVRTYQNIFFRGKMLLMVLAGLNAGVFHAGVFHSVSSWDLDRIPPRRARFAGAASLILWGCIIVAGRMIAYNWFDCERQPQPAIINWAAGCVVEALQ
jgi:hypothetical protein